MCGQRKCTECGAALDGDHVMRIRIEDGSWETIPLTICPDCFKKHMRQLAQERRK